MRRKTNENYLQLKHESRAVYLQVIWTTRPTLQLYRQKRIASEKPLSTSLASSMSSPTRIAFLLCLNIAKALHDVRPVPLAPVVASVDGRAGQKDTHMENQMSHLPARTRSFSIDSKCQQTDRWRRGLPHRHPQHLGQELHLLNIVTNLVSYHCLH